MSYSKIQISVETLYKRKVFTFIGHYMKIRNIAFIAIAQRLKDEGEEKRKQLRMDEGKQVQNPAPSAKEFPKEMKKVPSN